MSTLADAALQLVVISTGLFLTLGFWLIVQNTVRKRSGCRSDHDVLDFMAHGCASCINGQTCKNRMKNAGLNPGTEHNSNESE